ncbi:MAG: hypothetical protein HY673_26280 [Chloroflexi bacterium]|nr:hypothetical protein [Chloroflexota bacterium]
MKAQSYFRRARIEFGTITCPNEQDFSPETIEARIKTVEQPIATDTDGPDSV